MDKIPLMLGIILILLIPSACSIDEYDLEEGELDIDPLGQAKLEQTQATILAIGGLSEQIDSMTLKNVENMETLAGWFEMKQQQFQTNLYITIILVGLALLGMWWAIFLHLKAKKLI